VPQVETHELQIVTLQRVTDKRHYVRYSERYCTAAACAHQRPHDGGLVIFRHGQAVAGQRARAAAYAPSGSELPWRRRAARSGRLGSATSTPTACSTGSTPHRSWRSLPPRRSRWPQCLGPTSRRLVTGRARREFPVCQRFNGIGDDRHGCCPNGYRRRKASSSPLQAQSRKLPRPGPAPARSATRYRHRLAAITTGMA
jgi:hypothetical protein